MKVFKIGFCLILLAAVLVLRYYKNQYFIIELALFTSFLVYLYYQWFYKQPKEEQKSKKKKLNQIQYHLRRLKKYTPDLNKEKLPQNFIPLIPFIEIWGIKNEVVRNYYIELSTENELLKFKETIEPIIQDIKSWLTSQPNKTKEKDAVELTLNTYYQLGLWTWDNKTHTNNLTILKEE